MTEFPIRFDSNWGCIVRGSLVASDDPADLGEDMLEVVMPSGLLLCAGWTPESDPGGNYVITLTSGIKLLIEPFETSSHLEAIQTIGEIVSQYYWRNSLNVSQSQDVFPVDKFEYA